MVLIQVKWDSECTESTGFNFLVICKKLMFFLLNPRHAALQ